MSDVHFLSLKGQIEEEYHLLSLGLSAFSDEDLSETLYMRFSRQIDYLQSLFDGISEEFKSLDLDIVNPEMHKLLDAKQAISDYYGQFNRLKNIFCKRFAQYHNTSRRSSARPMATAYDFPLLLSSEEGKKSESSGAHRTAGRAIQLDEQRQINRHMQEEAARLGILAHPDQPVSEADLQHERIRQEEQRQQEAARETARIQEETEALRRMQTRMEQADHFDRVQHSHIDMSRDRIGHHNSAQDTPAGEMCQDFCSAAHPLQTQKATFSTQIPQNLQRMPPPFKDPCWIPKEPPQNHSTSVYPTISSYIVSTQKSSEHEDSFPKHIPTNASQLIAPNVKAASRIASSSSTAIKTSVRNSAHTAGHTIATAVPTGIKTGIRSVIPSGSAAKNEYTLILDRFRQFAKGTKQWFYHTSAGQGVAALTNLSKNAADAFYGAIKLLKSATFKGIFVFGLLFLIVSMLSLGFGMTSATFSFSTVASTETSEHGKVDLMPYTRILQSKLLHFTKAIEAQIEAYEDNPIYEDVLVTYYGELINYHEILSVMAVRMEQSLNQQENIHINQYLNYLFDLSHEYSVYEREYYCDGCELKKEANTDSKKQTHIFDYVGYCPGHTDVEIEVITKSLRYMLDSDDYTYEGDDWDGWNEENREWCMTIYKMDWGAIYDGVLLTCGTGPEEIIEGENESFIWNCLVSITGSTYGAAGIMGNLYLASGLESSNLAEKGEISLGYSDSTYTSAINNGYYTNFANDNAAYGIAQWQDPAQKARLLKFADSNGRSVGDLYMQLAFLSQDLSDSGILALISDAKTVREASDCFLRYISGGVSGDFTRDDRTDCCYYFYNKYVLDIPAEGELTDKQIAVITVAKNSRSYGIIPLAGYCQLWASKVYAAAGFPRDGSCCAFHSGISFGVSGNWDEIVPGAAVYGYSGQEYGHVGIYVGNGLVYHNTGVVTVNSLQDWIAIYDGFCWGWEAGTDLTVP